MVIIELFTYVSIISMMVFCANVMKKKGLLKKLDSIYFFLLLTLIISQIIITAIISSPILPQTEDSNPSTILICIGAILALALIYIITRIVESSTETHEYARKFTLSAMFIVLGASFCAILIWPSETNMDLYRMPFALALCIGMVYYPSTLDQLIGMKGDAEKSTPDESPPEDSISNESISGESVSEESMPDESADGYKEAIIKLATESWHFTTVYQRMLTILDASEHRKYTSQLRWHLKKMEESLDEGGLRIVNVEGQPYDPGMAVIPSNIEDFDEDVPLVVSRMLEPIIMEGTALAKMGKVTLKRRIIEE